MIQLYRVYSFPYSRILGLICKRIHFIRIFGVQNAVYFVRILKYTSYTNVSGIRNTVYFVRILKYSSYTNVWGIRNIVYFMRIQYVFILYI